MNSRLWMFLLAGLTILQIGCGTARRGTPVQEPVDTTDPQVERGQHVFMEYCNGCHPGGAGGLGLAINDKPLPDFAIRTQVRRGLGVMPGFSEEIISDEELNDLVVYLKTLRRHDG